MIFIVPKGRGFGARARIFVVFTTRFPGAAGGRFVKVVLLSRCLLCSVSFYDYSVTSMSYCAV